MASNGNEELSRGKLRGKRAARSGLALTGSRLFSLLTNFIAIPIALQHLGLERYGIWMTMTSILLLLAFADFGISNALLTTLSNALGKNEFNSAQALVSNSFALLMVASLGFLSIFWLSVEFIDLRKSLNLSRNISVDEVKISLLIFILIFCAGFPIGGIERIRLACQEGHITAGFSFLGNAVGFLSMLYVTTAGKDLPWLIFTLSGIPCLFQLSNGVLLFISRPYLRPRVCQISGGKVKTLTRTGSLFFVLQLTASVSYHSDNILIAHIFNQEMVAFYSVPNRLFGLMVTLASLAATPLWAAYGEAFGKGDKNWIKANFQSSLKIFSASSLIAGSLLVLFSPYLLRVWVGETVNSQYSLLIPLGLLAILLAVGNLVGVLYNAMGILRFQIITATFFSIISVLLKIVFAMHWGLPGVPWATITAYIICVAIPATVFVPKLFRENLR